MTDEVIDEVVETPEPPVDEAVVEAPETPETPEPQDDGVEVTIGDEKPEETDRAPDWVRELRQKNRDLAAENHRLRAQQAPASQALGAKPTLEAFEFDAEKYEAALATWMQRKSALEAQEAETAKQLQAQQTAWQAKVAAYGTAKAALNVPDFADAEAAATEILSETQQAIIVKGAKNPALVILALGKNPKKAKELAALHDPVEFAVRIGELETQLKVTKRTPTPPNDKPITNTTPRTGAEAQLDKLREKARETGDMTPVIEYKRKMREKA